VIISWLIAYEKSASVSELGSANGSQFSDILKYAAVRYIARETFANCQGGLCETFALNHCHGHHQCLALPVQPKSVHERLLTPGMPLVEALNIFDSPTKA
jgi:hypothetical protein